MTPLALWYYRAKNRLEIQATKLQNRKTKLTVAHGTDPWSSAK